MGDFEGPQGGGIFLPASSESVKLPFMVFLCHEE